MIWIIGAALVAILAVALAQPMLMRGSKQASTDAHHKRDLGILREQLNSLEADTAAGRIAPEEAARMQAEIARRMFRTSQKIEDSGKSDKAQQSAGFGVRVFGLLILALTLGGALWAYTQQGAPDLPDAPRQARIAAAKAQYDQRPSQQEAELLAEAENPRPGVSVPDDIAALIDELRRKVGETPTAEGLRLLAEYEVRLGNLPAAREALENLIAIQGDASTADDHVGLAALMIEAAGGLITLEAEHEIATALQHDPDHAQARFLRGLLLAQNGRPDRSFEIWRRLLEEGPEDAPWIGPIRQSIAELAWMAGVPDYTPPSPGRSTAGTVPMLDPDAMAAIQELSPEDQAELISGMVAGLETRLAEEGGPPEDWAQLVRSLAISGEVDRARAIRDEALEVFGDNAEARQLIEQAGAAGGL